MVRDIAMTIVTALYEHCVTVVPSNLEMGRMPDLHMRTAEDRCSTRNK